MAGPVRDTRLIGAIRTLPVPAARLLLCAFCLLVPIIIWNGLPTAVTVKMYLGQMLILLASIPLFVAVFINKQSPLHPTAAVVSVLPYCLFVAINSVCHKYSDPAVLQGTLLSVLLFFEVLVIAESGKGTRVLLYCLCASGGIVGLYFALQKCGMDVVTWQWPEESWAGSTFSNRNLMVYFILCVFPFGIYLLHIPSVLSRILVGIATALMLFTLVSCHSRISLVVLALSAPAYLFYAKATVRSQQTKSIILALFVFSLLLLVSGACILGYRLAALQTVDINRLSHSRIQLWMDTARLIADSPLVGHGVGSFARIFPAFQSDTLGYMFPFDQPVFFSHNETLEILVESGAFGLGLFTIMLIACLIPVFRMGFHTVLKMPVVFFSCVSLAGCFIFSLVGEACHMFICSAFSWIVLAICHANSVSPKKIPPLPGLKPPVHLWIIGIVWGAGTVIALVSIARSFLSDMYLQRAIYAISLSERRIDPIDALPDIETSLGFNGHNLYARYQLAYIKTMQGEHSQALSLYTDIQKSYPFFENTQYNKGVIYFLQKDCRKAIDTIIVAYHRYPTSKNSLFYLACSYFELGDLKNCGYWCDLYTTQDTTNARINMMAAWTKKEMNGASR